MLTLTIRLTPQAAERIRKPIHGSGGFQGLLKRYQARMEGNVVTLTEFKDIERTIRYMTQYGDGGFERRLLGIKE